MNASSFQVINSELRIEPEYIYPSVHSNFATFLDSFSFAIRANSPLAITPIRCTTWQIISGVVSGFTAHSRRAVRPRGLLVMMAAV